MAFVSLIKALIKAFIKGMDKDLRSLRSHARKPRAKDLKQFICVKDLNDLKDLRDDLNNESDLKEAPFKIVQIFQIVAQTNLP